MRGTMAPMYGFFFQRFLATALLCAGALLGSVSVQAEIVENIYSARLTVEGRDARSLAAARKAGLAEVIIKASGNPQAVERTPVVQALDDAQGYLLGYSYEEGVDNALVLRLEYDEQAVQRLLAEADLRLWTANRPLVLTWLVISDERGRRFASLEAAPSVDAMLKESFARRGVPLQTPLYDLSDTSTITLGEAWRQSSVALIDASDRYGDAELLAGRVARLSDGSWVGDWRYLDNGRWTSRSTVAANLEAFTNAGAELVAATLAEQYGVKIGADRDDRYRIVLRGIRSFADYKVVQESLGNLEAVRAVVPESLLGDQVSVRVEAETDVQQLAKIIELDARFVALPREPGQDALFYEWIP
ncbi:DUF2066 domain-containing protein [Congregibacter litoralis]|uniref:DUF2066 domain-containing protein n=1 Tax=Congregibacter litoralis KT71 TaxID=314285 RepID=A4ACL5_9GAMM|nr:DUF2066 domain-containing protein [Congregibacter litoralis]EAQ96229.1 hypothetical protein KT71_19228 [Congregibacter litoralis KT71]